MPEPGFAMFETALGPCGVAWGERGILAIQLPEGREAATRASLSSRVPGASEQGPPREIRSAIAAIIAHLRGDARTLSGIELDMTGVSSFHRRVYEAARTIAPGTTLSYGELAAQIGAPGAARAVGQALGRNPFPIVVPCHRVLAAGGGAGGFSAGGGVATKMRILAAEGVSPTSLPPRPRSAARSPSHEDSAPGLSAALESLRGADPVLRRLIERVGPCRLEVSRPPSIFWALARAIVFQQLSGKAASTIFGRVCALFPPSRTGFSPEQMAHASDAELRGAGISRPKLLALRDLSARAQAGEIPNLAEARRLSDDELVERLTVVRGIGRWTVEMLLLFHLGRPDVLPLDDYGIRKGYARAFRCRELPAPDEIERRGERWRPHRSVASWYLWRALDVPAR